MSRPGHSADRRGDGLLHGGRRLRAGDERTNRSSSRSQGTIFLGGPPLVKAATGEIVSAEDLGGGDVHTRFRAWPTIWRRTTRMRSRSRAANRRQPEPAQGASRCCNRVPRVAPAVRSRPTRTSRHHSRRHAQALRRARDHRPHRRRLRVRRIQGAYGTTLVTGFAHIDGYPVGIVANNGILFSESALKGAHFIELCLPAQGTPLVFLQNITGFMVGRKYEAERHRQATARRWSPRCPPRTCRSSPSSSAAATARATTACAAAPTRPRFPVDVAERAHLGDGRRAGGERARHRASATASKPRAAPGAPKRRMRSSSRSVDQYERQATRTTRARGCGTTA